MVIFVDILGSYSHDWNYVIALSQRKFIVLVRAFSNSSQDGIDEMWSILDSPNQPLAGPAVKGRVGMWEAVLQYWSAPRMYASFTLLLSN